MDVLVDEWMDGLFSVIKSVATSHENEHRNNRENVKVGAEDSQSRDGVGGILEKKNISENILYIHGHWQRLKPFVVVSFSKNVPESSVYNIHKILSV